MSDFSDTLAERIERRPFLRRVSRAAFAGAVSAGALLARPGTAHATNTPCGCCTLAYTTRCVPGAHCGHAYYWQCSGGGCTCTCHECYSPTASHQCSLATCNSGCTANGYPHC
jgi:hypothetical protein